MAQASRAGAALGHERARMEQVPARMRDQGEIFGSARSRSPTQWGRSMAAAHATDFTKGTGRRKRLRGFGELRIPYRPFVQLAAGRTLGPHRPRTDTQKGADFGRDPDIDRASCGRASEYQAFHGRPHTTRILRPPRGKPGIIERVPRFWPTPAPAHRRV